jgi:hypothetical protein
LEGVIDHKFPAGLKHEEIYLIKGKGVTKPDRKKGDQHLTIKIVYSEKDKDSIGVISELYRNEVKNKT